MALSVASLAAALSHLSLPSTSTSTSKPHMAQLLRLRSTSRRAVSLALRASAAEAAEPAEADLPAEEVVAVEEEAEEDVLSGIALRKYVKQRLPGGFAAQRITATGRRKTAIARVVLQEGTGKVFINFRDAKILENGLGDTDSVIIDRDSDPGSVLIQLARDTEQLAMFERKNFCPVLRRWHSAPVAVAAVTLHGCFGVVLRQYLAKEYLQGNPMWMEYCKVPLMTLGFENNYDVFVKVHGGGLSGQAQAICLGVARALVKISNANRVPLKSEGLLTRDTRIVERKKAGLKKARKRPQFSKR